MGLSSSALPYLHGAKMKPVELHWCRASVSAFRQAARGAFLIDVFYESTGSTGSTRGSGEGGRKNFGDLKNTAF